MKMGKWLLVAVGLTLGIASAASAQTVEIEYWQYTFAQRVQAIDELIKRFEAENPGIKVKHTHVPYDDFRLKIAAAIPAGQGPDVVQLFYGWLQDYLKAKLLQPLPGGAVPRGRDRARLLPAGEADEGGRAVLRGAHRRALARPVLEQEAVHGGRARPAKPPQTLDELLDHGPEADQARRRRQPPPGRASRSTWALQDHHWLREVLIRQMGGQPYSADGKSVAYNNAAGHRAVGWYTDLADQAEGRASSAS